MSTSHILVVDDDESTRQILECILERDGHLVTCASDGADALLEVGRARPDIVVTDWHMPEIDGTSLCQLIRQRVTELSDYVYIILMTARTDEVSVADALNKGADSFLAKPFHGDELLARIGAATRITNLHSRLLERHRVDPLTQLLDNDTYRQLGRDAWFQAFKKEKPLTAVTLNLDYFSAINHTYGFSTGDVVLGEVARIVAACTAKGELCGRIGPDEFGILMADENGDSGQRIEHLHQLIQNISLQVGRREIRISGSVGIARSDQDSRCLETLLDRSKASLKQAKRRGRSQISRFDQTPNLEDAMAFRR